MKTFPWLRPVFKLVEDITDILCDEIHAAHRLRFHVKVQNLKFTGDRMNFSTPFDVTIPIVGSIDPITATGAPSGAALSGIEFVSSDETIATVLPDPSNPLGFIVTQVAPGVVDIDASALATEAGGVTNEIGGILTITLTTVAPVDPAASLEFTITSPVAPPVSAPIAAALARPSAIRAAVTTSRPDPNTRAGRAALAAKK